MIEEEAYNKLHVLIQRKGFKWHEILKIAKVSELSYGSFVNALDDWAHIEMRLNNPEEVEAYMNFKEC